MKMINIYKIAFQVLLIMGAIGVSHSLFAQNTASSKKLEVVFQHLTLAESELREAESIAQVAASMQNTSLSIRENIVGDLYYEINNSLKLINGIRVVGNHLEIDLLLEKCYAGLPTGNGMGKTLTSLSMTLVNLLNSIEYRLYHSRDNPEDFEVMLKEVHEMLIENIDTLRYAKARFKILKLHYVDCSHIDSKFFCHYISSIVSQSGIMVEELQEGELNSSWLRGVAAFEYMEAYYVSIIIEESGKEYSYIFCNVPVENVEHFFSESNTTSYGNRFHRYIDSYKCSCE